MRRDGGLTTDMLDPTGLPGTVRFNRLQPPFDNPAIRRALLGAVSQADFMQAVAGIVRPPAPSIAVRVGHQHAYLLRGARLALQHVEVREVG